MHIIDWPSLIFKLDLFWRVLSFYWMSLISFIDAASAVGSTTSQCILWHLPITQSLNVVCKATQKEGMAVSILVARISGWCQLWNWLQQLFLSISSLFNCMAAFLPLPTSKQLLVVRVSGLVKDCHCFIEILSYIYLTRGKYSRLWIYVFSNTNSLSVWFCSKL